MSTQKNQSSPPKKESPIALIELNDLEELMDKVFEHVRGTKAISGDQLVLNYKEHLKSHIKGCFFSNKEVPNGKASDQKK